MGMGDHMNQIRKCAVDFWKDKSFDTRNGTYDAYIYRQDLTSILSAHDETQPLFLYLSLRNVHNPLQAPKEWLDLYPTGSTCEKKTNNSGNGQCCRQSYWPCGGATEEERYVEQHYHGGVRR